MTRIQTGRNRGHRVVAWLAAIATSAGVLAGPVTARAAAHADTVSPAAPLAHAGPPVTHPCHEGRILCGRIRVPLYWSLPDGGGRSLAVRFRVYPHTAPARRPPSRWWRSRAAPATGRSARPSSTVFMLGPLHRTTT